jgi:AcrR family transcriptional regulator
VRGIPVSIIELTGQFQNNPTRFAAQRPGNSPVRTKTPTQAEKMLNAAGRLFGTQRFHEVRMEDIAAEAAVGKGTLYRYFNDKEELYLALLERASQQVLERIHAELTDAEGPREKLVAMATALIAFFDEQPQVFDLIQRAEVLQREGAAFPWQTARDEMARLLREFFKEARQRGEFAVADADHAVLMFLGGLRAVVRFGRRPRPRNLAQQMVRSFLDGAGSCKLTPEACR